MCDYSIKNVRSRPAQVGDKLTTRDFGAGTRGFCDSNEFGLAVCVLPGTELAFARDVVANISSGLFSSSRMKTFGATAIFRQINKDKVSMHHDALEFPDGNIVLLTSLSEGQSATVLQLPADPSTLKGDARAKAQADQRRVTYIG